MKIDRLFGMTNYLVDRKNVTAEELAREFQVSVRTVYRDIDILSANGIPVYTSQGKGGGISLIEGYTIDKTLLSETDQDNILMALQSLSATGQEDLEKSLTKMRGLFQKDDTNWIEIDFSSWNQGPEDRKRFEMIRDSILSRQVIQFSYFSNKGKQTERVAEPIKLFFKSQSWYVYCFCRKRKNFRYFKLSRMDNFSILEEHFVKREVPVEKKDYQPELHGEPVALSLWVDLSMAFRVYDEFRKGSIERRKDGFYIQVEVPKSDWMYAYFFGFGDCLEILEPESIRHGFFRYMKHIAKKYK